MTSIVIPYRGGQNDRERAFRHTRQHLASCLPEASIETADSGHEKFNRAASRNRGVREAESRVVVVCDADTLPEAQALSEAVDSAEDGRLHLPHTYFLSLSPEHTDAIIDRNIGLRAMKPEFVVNTAVGGCLVMTREAYLSVQQDEEFRTWGGEDVAFKFACDTLLGETVRHSGKMFGLWHPSEMKQDSLEYKQNMTRQNMYRSARGNREQMRNLIQRTESIV